MSNDYINVAAEPTLFVGVLRSVKCGCGGFITAIVLIVVVGILVEEWMAR